MEDVLRVPAAAIVAAKRHVHSRPVQVEDRRGAALELEIADWIVHDARARAGDPRNLLGREPDAVDDAQPFGHQAGLFQDTEQRTAMPGKCPAGRRRLHPGFVDMRQHRQSALFREGRDPFEQFRRAPLWGRRTERPALTRRRSCAAPLHLTGNEVEFALRGPALARDCLEDMVRRRPEGMNDATSSAATSRTLRENTTRIPTSS